MVEESGDLDSPFHRVEFNLNTLEYTETTNPLTKNAKVEKSSFLSKCPRIQYFDFELSA